jgi:hypothetical protein
VLYLDYEQAMKAWIGRDYSIAEAHWMATEKQNVDVYIADIWFQLFTMKGESS